MIYHTEERLRYINMVRAPGVNYVYIDRPRSSGGTVHWNVGFWSTRRLHRAVKTHDMVRIPASTHDGYSALELDQKGVAT